MRRLQVYEQVDEQEIQLHVSFYNAVGGTKYQLNICVNLGKDVIVKTQGLQESVNGQSYRNFITNLQARYYDLGIQRVI